MHLKRVLLGLLFIVFQAHAADSVVLAVKKLENRVYHSVTTTTTNNEFNINAPKETLEKFEASGLKLPITISQKQTVDRMLKTSKSAKNGDMPFSGTLETTAFVQSNARPEAQNSKKNFEVAGAYRGGELQIDSVKGDGVTPDAEESAKTALLKVMDSVEFPQKPIKVGDSFSQKIPVTLPMQGGAPIKMLTTTHYTLKDIKNKQAHFDIKQEFALAPDAQQSQVTLTGTGSGTMTYDAAAYQVTAMATRSMMNMTVKKGELESLVKTVTDTDLKTTVASAK